MLFPPPESSSCRCHGYVCFLFDSSQTPERGGEAPSLATTAWGCLQQPHVGFPERDSKPDILRLQNTQVSRAKNSCHPAPAQGKGACLLRSQRPEGQLCGGPALHLSHPASCWRTAAEPAELLSPWAAGPSACTVDLTLGC